MKSRAQLIVKCLPLMGYVEEDRSSPADDAVAVSNAVRKEVVVEETPELPAGVG